MDIYNSITSKIYKSTIFLVKNLHSISLFSNISTSTITLSFYNSTTFSDQRGQGGSEMNGFENNTKLKVVSSSSNISMLSHPRSVEQGSQQVSQTFLSHLHGTRRAECESANIRGLVGLGVAAQMFCFGCQSYGYITPVMPKLY